MNTLKPDLIFLFILLVVPGLLSNLIFNSLVSRGKTEKKQVDLYQSLLHSVAIYTIMFPLVVLFFGVDQINSQTVKEIVTKTRWSPLITVLIVVAVSISWGILYSKFYSSNLLKNFLGRFATTAVEPTNIFSRLFSSKNNSARFWLTVRDKDTGRLIEGYLMWDSTDNLPREVYLKSVVYLDEQREVIERLPENTGVVINLDEHSIVEVTEVEE